MTHSMGAHNHYLETHMKEAEFLVTEVSEEQFAVHCLAPTTCMEMKQPIQHYLKQSTQGEGVYMKKQHTNVCIQYAQQQIPPSTPPPPNSQLQTVFLADA